MQIIVGPVCLPLRSDIDCPQIICRCRLNGYISFLMIFANLTTSMWASALVSALSAILSGGLLWYSVKSGRYPLCYVITIIEVFLILFPILFFTSGGYHSGMPAFFVFAVVFTVLILDRRLSIFFSLLELVVYIGSCLIAYAHPDIVTAILTERDTLVCFIAVSLSCGIVLYLHLREYDRQREQLQMQKEVLMEIDRHKTEFLGIGIHGNANQRRQNHAKGIIASQDSLHPAFRDPVVNDRADFDTDQNIGKHFFEGGYDLILGIGQALSLCQRGRVNIHRTGIPNKLFHIEFHVHLFNQRTANHSDHHAHNT